ncbi:MAG: outer membrane beta-barrel protein, partial [Stellaceae bacterium]
VDPYKNYACLDAYLGQDIFTRFYNYYRLEWGEAGPPADPDAPSPNREGWPRTPATTPPMPFTEWPTGATQSIGVTRPNTADSPFMAAIANTSAGQWMQDNHFQIYGWIDPGINLSSNTTRPGGNFPISYTYTPNTVQLDQAVLYIDRFPDTVQTDHIDWGLRLSGLYGENYRYTNSYGIASYQFNKLNNVNGYDFPMEYVDVYIPYVFQGMDIRVGRYISIPDIEAQLAPNNYTYTHSMTYAWDNYTNTGIVTSTQVTKNILVQLGLTDGTETPLWHFKQKIPNPDPNPLYPDPTYLKDPGNQPSLTACARFVWNDGWDTFYPCIDGINSGNWGYNNIQWHGFTYYHRFNDQWHLSYENYYLSEKGVPNLRNPTAVAIFENGGTPFSPQNVPQNPPNLAYCKNDSALSCNVWAAGFLAYLNYSPEPLDNFSFRPEFYVDPQGWRTGTGANTKYYEFTLGWQHWLSPQIELRPEVSYWRSLDTKAFNGNPIAGIPANMNYTVLGAMDMIIHF